MTHGIFITGTDTGVGKTRVGRAIARLLTERGLRVRPRKPVESGCPSGAEGLIPQDASELREAAGCIESLESVCKYRFRAAVSPERAAALEAMTLDLDMLQRACTAGIDSDDFLQVEGAGGFFSPLARGACNADLAGELGLPVLVVAADRLGTINHTLLTVEAIRFRGLALAGIVLNQTSPESDPQMDNLHDLECWLGRRVIRLPYCKMHGVHTLQQEAAALSPLLDAWFQDPNMTMPRFYR